MSVILDAINENLRNIRLIFEPTEQSFTKDTKKTGDAREVSVKEFLECYLPPSFRVRKGRIYAQEGSSNEIDCVLLAPNHPTLITPVREVIIAEGVHAAIEIKPDISVLTQNSEFFRGLKQIESVKKLYRTIQVMPTGFVPSDHSIPSVIFSNTSRSLDETTNYMIDLYSSGNFEAAHFPDLIVSMSRGVIFHTSCASNSLLRNFILQHRKLPSEKVFLEIPVDNNKTLALFLFLVYSFTPPEPYMCEPILKKYLSLQSSSIKLKEYL